jgi:hypothetical protein
VGDRFAKVADDLARLNMSAGEAAELVALSVKMPEVTAKSRASLASPVSSARRARSRASSAPAPNWCCNSTLRSRHTCCAARVAASVRSTPGALKPSAAAQSERVDFATPV